MYVLNQSLSSHQYRACNCAVANNTRPENDMGNAFRVWPQVLFSVLRSLSSRDSVLNDMTPKVALQLLAEEDIQVTLSNKRQETQVSAATSVRTRNYRNEYPQVPKTKSLFLRHWWRSDKCIRCPVLRIQTKEDRRRNKTPRATQTEEDTSNLVSVEAVRGRSGLYSVRSLSLSCPRPLCWLRYFSNASAKLIYSTSFSTEPNRTSTNSSRGNTKVTRSINHCHVC